MIKLKHYYLMFYDVHNNSIESKYFFLKQEHIAGWLRSVAMKNNSGNIKKMLEQLYSDRDQIGDAVFIVESQEIRAHRSILAALSPKYKAQFYGSNPDQGEIQIPDVSAAAFQEFLQFFYKESVNLTMGNIASVLDLAQQSLVEGSIEICVNRGGRQME